MRSTDHIPPAMNEKTYGERSHHLMSVFPPGDNPHIWYPPKSYAEFLKLRERAPELNRERQAELFQLMNEYERNGWIVNGDKLYDSQIGHVEWMASAQCDGKNSPTSFLAIGPAGTGKTKLLGMLMQADIRLQMRGVLKEPVVFATAKPYHMTTKTVGREYALRNMLHSPPLVLSPQHSKALLSDLRKMFPAHSKFYLSNDGWNEILSHREESISVLRKIVRSHMAKIVQKNGKDFSTQEHSNDFIHAVIALVAGRASTVASLDEKPKPELLEFNLQEQDEEESESYAGDAARGIPSKYPIMTGQSWNKHHDAQNTEHPLVILTTANTFTTVGGQQMIEKFDGGFASVYIDEALRTSRHTYQNPPLEAGAKHPPHVFAAAAKNYGRDWERISPEHSLKLSIGKTLPNIRTDVFPSREKEHYPAESEYAVEQLVDHFFSSLPLLQKEPHAMNTLLVVHSQLTGRVGRMLRERYERKHMDAQIHRYDGKTSDQMSAGKSQKALLEAWFVRSRKEGPNILITTPGFAKDALDLPNIERLVIGTRVTPDVLLRLTGRALHNNLHRTEGPQYGVLIAQQQFSNSSLGSTVFGVIDHDLPLDEKEGFKWVPGRILMSKLQHQKEASKGKKKPAMQVPGYKPSDPDRSIKTALGGLQYVVREKSGLPPPQTNINYSETKPTYFVVQQYLQQCAPFAASYTGSLTVTAENAWINNKNWPKEVLAHIERRIHLHSVP